MQRIVAELAVVVACLSCLVSGQVIWFGRCPKVNVQENFNVTQYLGKWYEQERFFAVFEIGQDCVSAEYGLQDASTVSVKNTGFSIITRNPSTAIGDAKAEDPKVPAKLGVRFSKNQPRGDYWVLKTDYTDYTVVWSCTKVLGNFINAQFGWILTRSPGGISESTRAGIYKMLNDYEINTNRFSKTNQLNCPGRQ